MYQMFYSLDKLKPKTKTKNKKQNFFDIDTSTFLYTLKKENKKTFFSPSKKMFSCPPYSKCIKKSSNFHLHEQKMFWFLVFSFWFQFIQRIEHIIPNNLCQL